MPRHEATKAGGRKREEGGGGRGEAAPVAVGSLPPVLHGSVLFRAQFTTTETRTPPRRATTWQPCVAPSFSALHLDLDPAGKKMEVTAHRPPCALQGLSLLSVVLLLLGRLPSRYGAVLRREGGSELREAKYAARAFWAEKADGVGFTAAS